MGELIEGKRFAEVTDQGNITKQSGSGKQGGMLGASRHSAHRGGIFSRHREL